MALQASRASTRVSHGPAVHSTVPSFAPRSSFSRRNRSVHVRAEWGAPVDFSSVKVSSNMTVFSGMHSVFLNVGSAIASTYSEPGQYIQVKVGADDKPGYFAIASAPGALDAGTVELLIKSIPGSAAEAIAAQGEGSALLSSAAQGKGFQLEKIPAVEVDTIFMFATGTGIVPLKSGLLAKGAGSKVAALLVGQKSMCERLTTMLTDAGVSKERILMNY